MGRDHWIPYYYIRGIANDTTHINPISCCQSGCGENCLMLPQTGTEASKENP